MFNKWSTEKWEEVQKMDPDKVTEEDLIENQVGFSLLELEKNEEWLEVSRRGYAFIVLRIRQAARDHYALWVLPIF